MPKRTNKQINEVKQYNHQFMVESYSTLFEAAYADHDIDKIFSIASQYSKKLLRHPLSKKELIDKWRTVYKKSHMKDDIVDILDDSGFRKGHIKKIFHKAQPNKIKDNVWEYIENLTEIIFKHKMEDDVFSHLKKKGYVNDDDLKNIELNEQHQINESTQRVDETTKMILNDVVLFRYALKNSE